MNDRNIIFTNVVRFFLLAFIQIFILRQIVSSSDWLSSFYVFLYPLFIFLLPRQLPIPFVLLLAFTMGFSIDIFYDTWGLHASASVMSALFRKVILRLLEPKGGYSEDFVPTRRQLGFTQFLIYVGSLLLIHITWYFCMEIFTHVYLFEILRNALFSFIASLLGVIAFQLIVNPVN